MKKEEHGLSTLPAARVRQLLLVAQRRRILVVGDSVLDQFVWGRVHRISPEAPVPVVEFDHENYMPGGAANVARNLTALGVPTALFSVIGRDESGRHLRRLLVESDVDCEGLVEHRGRPTSIKTRIIAQRQQVTRLDRETREELDPQTSEALLCALENQLDKADGVIVSDYGKGVITQWLLDEVRTRCRARGIWLSLDPKPARRLNLARLSLITPNRQEAVELARSVDAQFGASGSDPFLRDVAARIMASLKPALLLVTLGEHGMLLCQREGAPIHVPTVAREVFDVSGAGDTVIASFTAGIVSGASPIEAAILSNHAAGVVVGKLGTAVVTPDQLLESFDREPTRPEQSGATRMRKR
jgi:rfaE bifunctional protein kinase chain/domain